ncbi:MAG: glycosyltransferase [Candidatus Altiarchaeales archaeon]|nr:glycosyltransferase [Candidatus Altiarchaeales archaeon]
MSSLVIIPTYNERENLRDLVERILSAAESDVFIVDDQSPDGTGDVADELSAEHTRVNVMHRFGEKGRGASVRDGFKYALKYGYDFVLEMDADGSHQPKHLPRLLQMLKQYDVVVGSRYVTGGRVEYKKFMRKIASRFSNYFIRVVMGIPVNDVTCDFRGYRRQVLREVDLDSIENRGFLFGVELLYLCFKAGASIRETPIVFLDRIRGEPKTDLGVVLNYPLKVLNIKKRLYERK